MTRSKLAVLIIVLSLFCSLFFMNKSAAQSSQGLTISNLVFKGVSGNQPLPTDIRYDSLNVERLLWWDRDGVLNAPSLAYVTKYVPDSLIKATYILMPCNDKWTTDVAEYMTFDVNKDVVIFIAYDARQRASSPTFPNWLREWTMSQDSIMFLDGYKPDAPQIRRMDIYQKRFPAGKIVLGSNNGNGGYHWDALQYIPIFKVATAPSEVSSLEKPDRYSFWVNNYPNPFNPVTTVKFSIPENSWVELVIFNVLGQSICTLADGVFVAGQYRLRWSGEDQSGRAVPAGIYYLKLRTNSQTLVHKMLLLR